MIHSQFWFGTIGNLETPVKRFIHTTSIRPHTSPTHCARQGKRELIIQPQTLPTLLIIGNLRSQTIKKEACERVENTISIPKYQRQR